MIEPDIFAAKQSAFNRSPVSLSGTKDSDNYDVHTITKKI